VTQKVDLTPVLERIGQLETKVDAQTEVLNKILANTDKILADLAACCAYQKEMLDKMWYHVERTCYAVAEIEKETSLIDTMNAKLTRLLGSVPAPVVTPRPVVTPTPVVAPVMTKKSSGGSSEAWRVGGGVFTANDLPKNHVVSPPAGTGIPGEVKGKQGTSYSIARTLTEGRGSRIVVGVDKVDYKITSAPIGTFNSFATAQNVDLTIPYLSYHLKLGAGSKKPSGLYIGAKAGAAIQSRINNNRTTDVIYGGLIGYDLPRFFVQADLLTSSGNTLRKRLQRGVSVGVGARF
jgi:hypothetical protein